MMNKRYDAVIIGGGHNGLVAAALLAKAGKQVLVLERRSTLGGAAATEAIYPGFKFNVGASNAGMFRPELISALELDRHGLQFVTSPVVAYAPQPDGPGLTLWRDRQRTQAEFAYVSPHDAAMYQGFTQLIGRLTQVLDGMVTLTPPNIVEQLNPLDLFPWAKTALRLRQLGKKDMMEFVRILPMTVSELLNEWFESEAVKGLLAGPGVSGVMQGPYASGTAFMFLYHHLSGGDGVRATRFVRGGMGQLSVALASAATLYGAEIRLGAEVQRILVKSDEATGVLLSNGDEISAKTVLSGADPRRTLFGLVGPHYLEPRVMRRVRNIRFRGSTAKVNLALAGMPRFSGLKDGDTERLSGHIVISPSVEYLERAYDDAKYGQYSAHPYLDVVIPSLLDPSLAPAGQHVMSITMQYAPYHLREGDWDQAREGLGDLVVDTLSEYAPNLRELILHRQVLTPLDLEREIGLTEGSIYHGQMDLDQLLFMRPIAGYGRYGMPIRNLYLCGAGSHPGGGVTGAPGMNAAREVLKALS
jgi:phytoene dehydrogenase-like protein